MSISRFAVENELDEAVRLAFLDRPHLVDSAPGFIRMEVANPCADAKEYCANRVIQRLQAAGKQKAQPCGLG